MDGLNYHHLALFQAVAREGSVKEAATRLGLSQATVSSQVRSLEAWLGHELFNREGRGLILTRRGRVALDHADRVFGLGDELVQAVRDAGSTRTTRLVVGVIDVLPKLAVRRLLAPLLAAEPDVRLIFREDPLDVLLAQLATQRVDVILSDLPAGPNTAVRAFNHLLGESGLSFFAAPALAERWGGALPGSLDSAPFLFPAEDTSMRRLLEAWLRRHGVRADVVAEFEDSALAKAFGEDGAGIFVAPSIVADDVCRQHGVVELLRDEESRERLYLITTRRRLANPGVARLASLARGILGRPADADPDGADED